MLAPFAPHIAKELDERLGHAGGLFETARWPSYDEAKTRADTVEVVVQVNGRLRARLRVDAGADEAAVTALAKADENVARHLAQKPLRKVVWVPGRLLNLVTG